MNLNSFLFKYFVFGPLILFLLIKSSQTLQCKHLSPDTTKIYPKVIISRFNITIPESKSPDADQSQANLTFNPKEIPRFTLVCEHSRPIRWVIDEDALTGSTQLTTPTTSRIFTDFYQQSSYTYRANYYLEVTKTTTPFVFSCQTFDPVCQRTVVLVQVEQGEYRIRQLDRKEESLPVVREFDKVLENHDKDIQGINSNTTCPFNLTLYLTEAKALVFGWEPGTGSIKNPTVPTAQSLYNAGLRFKQMPEKCILFATRKQAEACISKRICTGQINYGTHGFFPIILEYTLRNERRVLKGYFDMERRDFYYIWEQVPPQKLIDIVIPQEVYKGESILVECYPSVFLYSLGTQIAWVVVGRDKGLINQEDLSESDKPELGGSFVIKGSLNLTHRYLTDNQIHSVNISCISPEWNSAQWVEKSTTVRLLDSEPPEILGDGETLKITESENNFTIHCEAKGTPVPNLEITPPKLNLNLIKELYTSENGTIILSITFPRTDTNYEGTYTCLASSTIGYNDTKSVEYRQKKFPFLLTILIATGAITLLFVVVAIALIYKLKREKAEFIKLTEEAVRKFQEGFNNTQDLGFKSNSEHKEYEIPLSRWGIGDTLLGSGAFGVVKKGVIYFGDNRQSVVAVKSVNSPKDITDFENSLMELTIMSYIGKHEHVVSLVAACTANLNKRNILIGVEYCGNGDLLNYLQRRKALFRSFVKKNGQLSIQNMGGDRDSYANVGGGGSFSTMDLYRWAYQIGNGMNYLVSKKVLHGDLAARNVLLTQDNVAKISDFGLSRQLILSDNYTKKTNTPLPWRWMAVESLKFRQFSPASDVWAYGVTLYEIFSLGSVPWPSLGWTLEFVNELEQGRRLERPENATENMYSSVMLECWRPEPENRISFGYAKDFFEIAMTHLNSPEGKDDEFLNTVC